MDPHRWVDRWTDLPRGGHRGSRMSMGLPMPRVVLSIRFQFGATELTVSTGGLGKDVNIRYIRLSHQLCVGVGVLGA